MYEIIEFRQLNYTAFMSLDCNLKLKRFEKSITHSPALFNLSPSDLKKVTCLQILTNLEDRVLYSNNTKSQQQKLRLTELNWITTVTKDTDNHFFIVHVSCDTGSSSGSPLRETKMAGPWAGLDGGILIMITTTTTTIITNEF